MEKTIATMLYVTYLAFGISAHAAETQPLSDNTATDKETGKSEKKARRAADRGLSKNDTVLAFQGEGPGRT